jgi:hypothetical protein
MTATRYPVYVISKGRFENCLTAKFLVKDGTPFKLVVEPQEADEYISRFGADTVLVLPFSNLGLGSIPARNWVWEHSKSIGAERHWILDDNIRKVRRLWKGKRIPCESGVAFRATEDFTDRYENIGIAGLNYTMFVLNDTPKPFYLNVHVYSCLLIRNDLPYRWRGRYNEDTDLCLQVLAGGLCTILLNVFNVEKMPTMIMKGGNMDALYQGDGRLKMARSLERMWPGVVTVKRRFKRPQHVIKDAWGKFDTPLKLKPGIDLASLKTNEYGMNLKAIADVKSESLREIVGTHAEMTQDRSK